MGRLIGCEEGEESKGEVRLRIVSREGEAVGCVKWEAERRGMYVYVYSTIRCQGPTWC